MPHTLARMLTQRLALVTGFLLLLATAAVAAPPGTRTLELEIDPGAPRWSGQYVEWLAVSPSTGLLAKRLHGPLVDAVELTDAAGGLPINWGQEGDTLLIEPRRAFSGTLAALRISYAGEWADSGAGVSRDGAAKRAYVPRLDGSVAPMSADPGAQRWSVSVHVPGTHSARSNLPVTAMERTGTWRTWTYRAGGAVSLDSARVTIAPATKAAPAKRAKKRRR
ncbi:MAG: hypothetical protein HZA61_02565 [Candidatus Eisenbacteria bacterium]|uniref:Uncharacterized protein n=1 Tax=Eiseniibacteriota bacterium TaxID=2212470 RepID=A0A933SBS3_UNCEI|nr:hypothetical protein [Candidatus Eisenbacteria bacterium]